MTSLAASLEIAGSGISAVNAQLALVSQNISNANTPGYVAEQLPQTNLDAAGQGQGVLTGVATRSIDLQLQQDVLAQNGVVSGLTTTQAALQPIDAAQGTVAGGNDLSSLLGNLNTAFAGLESSPSSGVQQAQVVSSAAQLASKINTLGQTYNTTRQTVQDQLVADVGSLNTALQAVGTLSNRIISARSLGQSTAGLEDQRDQALQTVSSFVGVKYLEQPNGGIIVTTTGGLTLPTSGKGLSLANAVIGPDSATQLGSVPGIVLDGQNVTVNLTGGRIGAEVALRDTTLPTYTAELDQFSQTLSTRFAQQGLTLFTDASGSVPASGGVPVQSGYVGYALSIQVNPAVQAAPSLVRDGTNVISGSPTGASAFTPNSDPAQTSFTALIQRVLDFSFGAEVQAGVTQSPLPSAGLGPAGGLSAPFSTAGSLNDVATSLVGAQSQDLAHTSAVLGNEQAVQSTLQTKFSSTSAVNTDTELATMIALQNSYGANAKIFTAVQSMWSQLLAAVT